MEYPLGPLLGSGTYSKVYGYGPDQNFDMVIKISELSDEAYLCAFMREIDTLKRLCHTNIIRIIKWWVKGYMGYIVMPRGKMLESAIQNGIITMKKAALDMLAAVQYLDSMGIIHGDIKPQNVVVFVTEIPFAVLIDFNISKNGIRIHIGSEEDKRSEIYYRGRAYSAYYRDPNYYYEMYNSGLSDIYGIGTTLYSFCVGEKYIGQTYPFLLYDNIPLDSSSKIMGDDALLIKKANGPFMTRAFGTIS